MTTTFLNHVGSVAEAADLNDGRAVRGIRNHPKYREMMGEALVIIENFQSGSLLGRQRFQEAMGTSDFPLLFADVLEREMLGHYEAYGNSWAAYARRRVLRDFREAKSFYTDGLRDAFTEVVPEGDEYPEAAISEGKYSLTLDKYGRRVPLTWEAVVNDDLDTFNEIPGALALAARRGEEYAVAAAMTDDSGPDATFFSGKILSSNPALTTAALGSAIDAMAQATDADGNPVIATGAVLVVPPALELTAAAILNATQIEMTERGGTAAQKLISGNFLANRFTTAVNPYLGTIPSSNGATSWYLMPAPSAGRPALQIGFLRGYETPALFRKSSNAISAGGGLADAMEGDFDTDAVEFKARHVFGVGTMDNTATQVSDGSGS